MRADVRSIMRITRLVTLFALVTGLAVGLAASPAAACSCIEPNDEQSFDLADAVFTGTIVEIIDDANAYIFVVEVDQVFKGEVTEWQRTTTAYDGAACGILLPTDTPVVLFGSQSDHEDLYSVGLCDPNRALTESDALFPDVEPYAPTPGGWGPDEFVDAPEPIEDTTAPPDEEPIDETESPLSERDQAELDAQAAFEETGGGATLIDGPAADDPSADDGGGLPIWLIVVLVAAGAVLVIELVRGRATAAD